MLFLSKSVLCEIKDSNSSILLIAILLVVKQMKKLARAKQHIEEINARLNELNTVLQDVNKQLKQSDLSLAESNHIKELFISSFLEICTQYIEKLDAFKGTVNQKVKAGHTPPGHKYGRKRPESGK